MSEGKKRIRTLAVLLLAALLVLGGLCWYLQPEGRARRFVAAHAQELEARLAAGEGVPNYPGLVTFNWWPGEHDMVEFILSALGNTYYGCYYSPDGVPLAFQNTRSELTPDGEAGWTWQAEGDNHGSTRLISGRWYYFEASF